MAFTNSISANPRAQLEEVQFGLCAHFPPELQTDISSDSPLGSQGGRACTLAFLLLSVKASLPAAPKGALQVSFDYATSSADPGFDQRQTGCPGFRYWLFPYHRQTGTRGQLAQKN